MMVQGFMKHIYTLINESDLIIEILDARFPEKTRNYNLENMTLAKGKKLIFVINKADLANPEKLKNEKNNLRKENKGRVTFISAKNKKGINLIKKEINIAGKNKEITIGIIGYPNVGKSTFINALSTKGKVKTSKKAGLTRGIQKIRIGDKALLIDSPGIIPKTAEEIDLFLVNSKNPNQLKDIEGTALKLIQTIGEKQIAKKYEINEWEDEEDLLDKITLKKNLLKKGGKPDSDKGARVLLEDYQK